MPPGRQPVEGVVGLLVQGQAGRLRLLVLPRRRGLAGFEALEALLEGYVRDAGLCRARHKHG